MTDEEQDDEPPAAAELGDAVGDPLAEGQRAVEFPVEVFRQQRPVAEAVHDLFLERRKLAAIPFHLGPDIVGAEPVEAVVTDDPARVPRRHALRNHGGDVRAHEAPRQHTVRTETVAADLAFLPRAVAVADRFRRSGLPCRRLRNLGVRHRFDLAGLAPDYTVAPAQVAAIPGGKPPDRAKPLPSAEKSAILG